MGSPIDVGGQYPFITFFTPPMPSGKFLLVWKAPECQDTLEISHDSGFCTESPENPEELRYLTFIALYSKYQNLKSS